MADLEPHVSPEWTRHAREHGDQAWVRLIALVDAHNQLSNPRIAEKIGSTMAELAGDQKESERAGWAALAERAREERMARAGRLVDSAEAVLPEDLLPLFIRSVDPMSVI